VALGGAVSGFTGIIYSEFRNRREEKQEIKRWFEKASNYISQIIYAVEKYRDDNDEGSQLQSTCADIAPRIREHVHSAPQEANNDLIQQLFQLQLQCEHVSDLDTQAHSGARTKLHEPESRVDELGDTANDADEKLKNKIENLTWI
jgi:gas vesicle protein